MAYPAKLSVEVITEAAAAVIHESGIDALGVRPVAERLGVRPSALYRYCGDGLGLVGLVAEHAAESLHDKVVRAMRSAARVETHERAAFAALASSYRQFARQQPALYAAMTTDTSKSSWTEQPGARRKALWNLLLDVVGKLSGNADDTSAAVAAWSFLHGFAALEMANLFGDSGPRDGFAMGVQALLERFEAQRRANRCDVD